MKKSFLFGLAAGMLCLFSATTVLAAVNTNINQAVDSQLFRKTQATVASTTVPVKGAIIKCNGIESAIKMKVAKYEAGKVKHQNAYNNMRTRLSALKDKLLAKGADISKLQSDLIQLDSKIAKFAADYDTYINKLKETQSFACGKSQGQFVAKLKEAKAALKLVWQDAKDIKDFYIKTIKPDLQAIRDQLNAESTSADANVNTSVNIETTQEADTGAANENISQ